jgi:hypothetical protein
VLGGAADLSSYGDEVVIGLDASILILFKEENYYLYDQIIQSNID